VNEAILAIKDLRTYFRLREGLVKAVDGVSLELKAGETLGLVGESGCGKTVTCLSILSLLQSPPAEIHSGEIWFDGRDLLCLSEKELNDLRGRSISMIFQEPMTSLNPLLTVGLQVGEVLRRHAGLSAAEAQRRAVDILQRVGISAPAKRAKEFPHQLSGGMRQRIMIAMALACNPRVLIADEPTTALDVTIQAQILDLMTSLQAEMGTSILLITHALAVIAETAQRVVVMYAGKVVEQGDVNTIFHHPGHPYTKGLLRSVPRLDQMRHDRLTEIPGMVPSLHNLPPGCAFAGRCDQAKDQCHRETPELKPLNPGHWVRCWGGWK
jgi:peptide/nickel transport system ATP-binding protein